MLPNLNPEDELNRYSIQLYARVVGKCDLREKDVLEIGCGRGGGASFVARYFHPASLRGIDLSGKAVQHCRRVHQVERLSFLQGDAGNLPLPSNSVHAVLNVESSHCYPSFDRFLDEVHRVLRPGGHFLFADIRAAKDVAEMRQQLAARFTISEEEVLTPGVVLALELDSERRSAFIQQRAPRFLQSAFNALAGVNGSPTFELLSSRAVEYVRFVCVRK